MFVLQITSFKSVGGEEFLCNKLQGFTTVGGRGEEFLCYRVSNCGGGSSVVEPY